MAPADRSIRPAVFCDHAQSHQHQVDQRGRPCDEGDGPDGNAGALFLLRVRTDGPRFRDIPARRDFRVVSAGDHRPGTGSPLTGECARRASSGTDVKITPGAKEEFPDRAGRQPLLCGSGDRCRATRTSAGQQEKFLFYRGLASFQPPLAATIDRDGRVSRRARPVKALSTPSSSSNAAAGNRVSRRSRCRKEHRPRSADADRDRRVAPRRSCATRSIGEGLYPREARRDGRDVAGFLVRGWCATVLCVPAVSRRCRPSAPDRARSRLTVKRVFVGRMEIVTPEIESEVAEAIRTSNQTVLRKYGRFLEPISQMVQQRLAARYDQQKVGQCDEAGGVAVDEGGLRCADGAAAERACIESMTAAGGRCARRDCRAAVWRLCSRFTLVNADQPASSAQTFDLGCVRRHRGWRDDRGRRARVKD